MKVKLEKEAFKVNGFAMLLLILFVLFVDGVMMFKNNSPGVISVVIFVFTCTLFGGFNIIQPNEAKVLMFFGKYIGSLMDDGFWWTNPYTVKKNISLRIRNFDSHVLKVNDANGNPIEISAVIVWKVVNSASAMFHVENYENFVSIQSETAIRNLANHHPYEATDNELSLRGNAEEISDVLKKELTARLTDAGVYILEARLSHLAYSPEIAQAMLRKQQAQAVISARQKIVEGAVGMVEMALKHLSENKIVVLDDERKASMVNNLLVTLVSENETRPVINTGSIY